MPTEKARYTITVDDDMLDKIEKYRYEHRLSSKNSATIELLRKGMEEFHRREEEQKNKAPTAEDAMEALYELLFFYLGKPPGPEQVKAFESIIPLLCNGLADLE